MRRSVILLAAAVLPAGPAFAQAAAPADLPTFRGRAALYSLSARGDVDGLILDDGTEVHLPPHLGPQLVAAVKPGDTVAVSGLRARAVPMVQALSIANDRTGQMVTDTQTLPAEPPPMPMPARTPQAVEGRIRSQLHGPRGDLNGVLLDNGTIIRLPPPEAGRLQAQLQPGAFIAARGEGFAGPLGHLVAATAIGPTAGTMVSVRPGSGLRP